MDSNIYDVYFEQIQAYFDKYEIDLKVHKTMIGEKAKSMQDLVNPKVFKDTGLQTRQ